MKRRDFIAMLPAVAFAARCTVKERESDPSRLEDLMREEFERLLIEEQERYFLHGEGGYVIPEPHAEAVWEMLRIEED